MPDIETIIKGMPADIQVLVKVPALMLGQEHVGRVFWKKNKVPRDLVLPLVNLIEDGVDKANQTKSKLQSELREMRESYEAMEKEKADLEKKIEKLNKDREKIEKAKEGFLSSFGGVSKSKKQ